MESTRRSYSRQWWAIDEKGRKREDANFEKRNIDICLFLESERIGMAKEHLLAIENRLGAEGGTRDQFLLIWTHTE